ncbi:MAG: conjugative transfer ATPase [Candidatus Paceibacterota bacterium]|jgi:conjugative transfer ATPase
MAMPFFGGKATKPQDSNGQAEAATAKQAYGRRRSDRPVTEAQMRQLYERPPSFTNYLPWLEFDEQQQLMLLADGRSVGVAFELRPVSTEARPANWLMKLRDQLQTVLSSAIPEHDEPWVLQLYVQDEPRLERFGQDLAKYAQPAAKGTAFTEAWLKVMDNHLQEVSRPGGLFVDRLVTGASWQGKERKVRGTLYRPHANSGRGLTSEHLKSLDKLVQETQETYARLAAGLEATGIRMRRYTGQDLHDWLLPWFNPCPETTGGDVDAYLGLSRYPGATDGEAQPYGWDFSEQLLATPPVADPGAGLWWFDNLPHRVVVLQNLKQAPPFGLMTHERADDDKVFALFDRMPEHTVLALTITLKPQDSTRSHLLKLEKAAFGDYADAQIAAHDANLAQHAVARGNKLYPLQMALYLRGVDVDDIQHKTNSVNALLLGNNLQPIRVQDDLSPLDSYLQNLPMNYDPHFDTKQLHRSRYVFSKQIASLAPFYGRSVGTGNPGLLFFNRGGEPLLFDPLNLYDRKKNGHLLLIGPTGSGKSATLVYMILSLLAMYRPRIFLIESGNSFGLLGDYLKSLALTVNAVRITPSADVSLPPFADALKLLDAKKLDLALAGELDLDDDPGNGDDSPEPGTEPQDDDNGRDILGEMEISARIMITGGEAREESRLHRADRRVIRTAIYEAALAVKAAGRGQVLTEDVEQALRKQVRNTVRGNERAEEMADALALFCSPGSFEAQLFNRPGQAWPDVDATIVDLGLLAREGYQDKLTVAYIGLMNTINNRVEQHQADLRPTLVITDEGHIITSNPLLAPYVIKITKMWRKLGAWFWIATQNLEDFPDASRRMLTMLEWWLCLVMPKDEIEQVSRFRQLTEEQTALLLAARKSPGQYTEGVVLTDHLAALFRNVPPAIALALGMTEKEEKAQRAALMRQHGCTELEAVLMVAEQLSKQRGGL